MRTLAFASAAAIALSVFAANADSHESVKADINDPVSLRMNMMKNVVAAIKPLGAMAKGEAAYDQAAAVANLRVMNAAALGFASQFPAGSDTGHNTEASPKIWTDMDGFKAAAAKFIADTDAAVAANPADLDAFKAVFGKVAGNCKSCHEGYRVKKE